MVESSLRGPTGPGASVTLVRMKESRAYFAGRCRAEVCLSHFLLARELLTSGKVMFVRGRGWKGGRWWGAKMQSAGHLGLCLGDARDEGVVARSSAQCIRGIYSCMAAFACALLLSFP
jgi:hypothetical protein